MENFITEELLNELGFKLISLEKSKYSKSEELYGKAIDKIGMTYIYWNTNGNSVTYFGEKLEANIGVLIKKDGDTRTAFNGYCFNVDDFKKVLKLTW